MNALQVQYTSCRRGQSSSSGFQVRSCSQGLSAAELLEIAQLGNYRLPNLGIGSAEGNTGAHPVALRYHRLQSGRYALIHSCYSGRDYSGREGNFMAHTLVPEHGPVPERPTDYLNWAGWKRQLTQTEDTDDPSPPLPPIDLATLPASAGGGRAFIATAPNGEAVLVDLLTALGLVRATSRRIVIRDRPDQGWRWIACLLELIPLGSAVDLTVSTYQFDSIDAADINATVDGSNFSFNTMQRDYEFFLFEPAAGLIPAFPDRDPVVLGHARQYAGTIVGWYLHEPDRLGTFMAFLDSFKPCRADNSLAIGLALFQASSQAATGGVEFRKMMDFIGEYTRPGGWDRSITLLNQALASQSEEPHFEDVYRLVRLCLSAGRDGDPNTMATQAFKGWLALLNLAVEEPGKYAARVEQCWTEIADQFDRTVGYRLLLGDDQMELLRNHYRRQNPESLALISRYLIDAVRATFRGPVFHHPDVCEMALAAINAASPRPCLAAILLTLNSDEETAALLAYLDAHIDSDARLKSVLAACLHDLTRPHGDNAWTLRRLLHDQGLSELLLAEFERIIASGDKRKIYSIYCQQSSALAPKYHECVKPTLARLYWDSLDEPQRISQAWNWFNANPAVPLDNAVMREVVIRVNGRLSVDPRDASQSDLARRLAEATVTQNIALKPDRPAIRQLLEQIGKGADDMALLTRITPLVVDLQEDEYVVATELVLRQLLPLAKAFDEHVALMSKIYCAPFESHFVDVYGSEIDRIIKSGKQSSNIAAIILASIFLATSGAMSRAARDILEQLAIQLAVRRENEIAEILRTTRRIIGPEKNEETLPFLKGVARFETDLRDRQSSFGNALRNMGRSLINRANPFRGRR